MERFQIQVSRKKDMRNDQIQYYSPVSVKELKSYGYKLIGYSDEEVVFLDSESYKNFMNFQGHCLNKIDNTVTPDEINNVSIKRK